MTETGKSRTGRIKWRPLLLAMPLLALVILDYSLTSSELDGYSPATGVVVDNVESECHRAGGRSLPCWYPVVEVETPEGETLRQQSSVKRRPRLPVGSEVDVWLSDAVPRRVKLGGFTGVWFRFSVVSVLAMAFVALAVLYGLFGWKLHEAVGAGDAH